MFLKLKGKVLGGIGAAAVATVLFALGPVNAAMADDAPVAQPAAADTTATPAPTDPAAAPAAAEPAQSPATDEPQAPASPEATAPSAPAAPTPEPAASPAVTTPVAAAPAPVASTPAPQAAKAAPAVTNNVAVQQTTNTDPPKPTCVKTTRTHTINWSTGTLVLTLKGGKNDKVGDTACNPLQTSGVVYSFIDPNSQWDQVPVEAVFVRADKIGVYTIKVTPIECGQIDFYASEKDDPSAVAPPPVLKGHNDPYEPDFVHQYSSGPTSYRVSSTYGCPGRPPVPPTDVKKVDVPQFVCGDTVVTITTTITKTPYKVVFVDGGWKIVPDTDNVTVDTTTSTKPLTDQEIQSCKPDVPPPTVVQSPWENGEWVCGDTTVTQHATITTTPYKAVLVEGSTWKIVPDTDNITVVPTTQVIPLTKDQIGTCPLIPGTIQATCVGSIPSLKYALELPVGFPVPENPTPMTATFINPDNSGNDYVVRNLPLEGQFLWPGASINPPNWPGWERNADGTYSETDGNYRWTREGVTVLFQVNPEYSVKVDYPPASSICANPPASTPPVTPTPTPTPTQPTVPAANVPPAQSSDHLASTGKNISSVPAWIGGSLGVAGIILLVGSALYRRRRRPGEATNE